MRATTPDTWTEAWPGNGPRAIEQVADERNDPGWQLELDYKMPDRNALRVDASADEGDREHTKRDRKPVDQAEPTLARIDRPSSAGRVNCGQCPVGRSM